MKKMMALLISFILLLSASAFADGAEPGLLRTAIIYDISTLDVAETTDNYLIPMNVFDRLFETRPADGACEVVKSLVTDYSVSADGLTYDFTLRDGVVFSNGSALTASDVQYSFERLLKIGDQNTDIPKEVVGGKAVLDKQADSLEGFRITDDTHFSITLAAPNAGFPAELSAPAASIVDAETTAAAKNFGKDPADTVGSPDVWMSDSERRTFSVVDAPATVAQSATAIAVDNATMEPVFVFLLPFFLEATAAAWG